MDVKGGVRVKVGLINALGLLVLRGRRAATRRGGGGHPGATTAAGVTPLLRCLSCQLTHALISQHHRPHGLQHAPQRFILGT